ncbi:MAG TPA: DoxX family protein [Kofleriaceae bacterium]|nr:DoxX family protein [Kofleriaceae bacterium]
MAYGTPLDPVADDTPVHLVPRSTTALVGRILISVIFLLSGISKLTHPAATIGYMNSAGVPNADVLMYIAAFAELLGGLAIVFGFLTRLGAAGLVIYLIPVTLYMHAFWKVTGMEAQMQQVNFVKNLAIMGGLLALAAFGPGRFSIDARMRRPLQP